MDNLSPKQRQKNMKNIKSQNTKPEIFFRKFLWERGLRYRKNYKNLPGTPDIVFFSKKIAVFIDGEFWHGFNWEKNKEKIQTRREYWIPKIEKNMRRDQEVTLQLKSMGWKVIRFWGKEVLKNPEECMKKIKETAV